jgi:phosphatidylcholine synthase
MGRRRGEGTRVGSVSLQAMPVAASPRARRAGLRRCFAWCVHLFTASAALADLLALLACSELLWREAALWMLCALAVDSVDGMLARAVGVSELLPHFDGRRLDDIVDYLSYVVVPAVFMIQAELLPHWLFGALMLLASAYGFSQDQAKTDDHYFLGFPSYWNIVAIYCWRLDLDPTINAALTAGLALLVFVPFKYLYPSRMPALRGINHVLATISMLLLVAAVVADDAARATQLALASLAYPIFYLVLSARWGGLQRATSTLGTDS